MQQFSPEEMGALTRAVVHHLDEWKISAEDMLTVLGLPEGVRSTML